MSEVYNDILKVGIGRVRAAAVADNYFPLVGETVKIDADLKWATATEWSLQNGDGETVIEGGNPAKNRDSKEIAVVAEGELTQVLEASNVVSGAVVQKTLYAMQAQALPYFDVITEEIVRVGETGLLTVRGENGYNGDCTAEVRLYKENSEEVYKTLDVVELPDTDFVMRFEYLFEDAGERGIYDVEVDVTDTATGETLSKRINKFITVTPKLCPKPEDTSTGYEVAFTYMAYTSYSESAMLTFEGRLWRDVAGSGLNYVEMVIPRGTAANSQWGSADVSGLPAGTTLVVKRDPQEPEPYPMRLFLQGNKNIATTQESGTANFTHEAPLVVTHDDEGVMQWGWRAYGAFQPGNNMRNIVIDGLGYHKTGIYFYEFDKSMFTDSCIYVNNGASDWEIFGLDIDGAGFVGITAKTDPNANMPQGWRENGFEQYIQVHHCKFRNTVGEGIYFGYFDTAAITKTNSAGQQVTYHAHLIHPTVYRCDFVNNGFDSVQINNATGVEFCYCTLDGCGYRREPNQGSAFSCTMDGRIYNCTVKNNYNVVGVLGPFLTGLEIFNCVLTAARMDAGWVLVAWTTAGLPAVVKNKYYRIHNNVVKAATIANIVGDVEYENYTMDDNIFITENGDTETPRYFVGSGNVFLKADENYSDIDDALKVADSINYNYQPAHNSEVVTAGKYGKAPFDLRGYKNWYIGNFHAGPLMGKYKDLTVVDMELALTGVVINGGEAWTYGKDVTVALRYNGSPTLYRMGETEDLSAVEWLALPEGDIGFSLSDGFGVKHIYAEVCNNVDTSAVVSSFIEYRKEPIGASMVLNGGKSLTTERAISVGFVVTGVYESLQYMLSESEDFADGVWADYEPDSEVAFELSSSLGEKTVYARLRSDDGQVVEMQGGLEYTTNKCIVAVGFPYQLHGFNAATGINQTKPLNNVKLYDIRGEEYCTLKTYFGKRAYSAACLGHITGDNSGVYPDDVLYYNVQTNVRATEYVQADHALILSGLKVGTYKVKLFVNGVHSLTSTMECMYDVQGDVWSAADKGLESVIDNFDYRMEWENVVVDESGELSVGIYTSNTGVRFVFINAIEIEEVIAL